MASVWLSTTLLSIAQRDGNKDNHVSGDGERWGNKDGQGGGDSEHWDNKDGHGRGDGESWGNKDGHGRGDGDRWDDKDGHGRGDGERWGDERGERGHWMCSCESNVTKDREGWGEKEGALTNSTNRSTWGNKEGHGHGDGERWGTDKEGHADNAGWGTDKEGWGQREGVDGEHEDDYVKEDMHREDWGNDFEGEYDDNKTWMGWRNGTSANHTGGKDGGRWNDDKECMCGSVVGHWELFQFAGDHEDEHEDSEHWGKDEERWRTESEKDNKLGNDAQASNDEQVSSDDSDSVLVQVALFAAGSLAGVMLVAVICVVFLRQRAGAAKREAVDNCVVGRPDTESNIVVGAVLDQSTVPAAQWEPKQWENTDLERGANAVVTGLKPAEL